MFIWETPEPMGFKKVVIDFPSSKGVELGGLPILVVTSKMPAVQGAEYQREGCS